MKSIYFLAFLATIMLTACASFSTSSGDTGVAYESGGYIEVLTNYSPFPNSTSQSEVYVQNADPYRDIIGNVLRGNLDDEIINFMLTEIEIEDIYMYCRTAQTMTQFLDGCELVVRDQISGNETILATLNRFDQASNELLFEIDRRDYTSFFKDYGNKEMYFQFSFNGYPPQPLEVEYRIVVGAMFEYQSEN